MNDIFIAHSIENNQIKHRKSRSSAASTEGDKDDSQLLSAAESLTESAVKNTEESLEDKQENRGTLKIDATVVPQDISYPTDTKLLNKAREISEKIIDVLYAHNPTLWGSKPRTYRREARKKWLSFSKTRRPGKKKVKAQKKKDLGYLRRNLNHIDSMLSLLLNHKIAIDLGEDLRKKMYVISEVYRQQKLMYDDNRKKVSDRIVSISQPWVRPIVRGKAGSPVEFGAKINISLTEKMTSVDQSSFDAYNEGQHLISQIESYKERFGYYPEYALADKIYLTRSNRKYLQEKGIKHTGSPLGPGLNTAKLFICDIFRYEPYT